MIHVLGVLFLVCASFSFADESGPFLYNSHGKRDPFSPLVSPKGGLITYESDITAADLILEGVLIDPSGKNVAIINGKMVKVGDQVASYTAELITKDQVELVKGQEHLTVKLKRGGV